MSALNGIVVLDFGSQFTQLIARRIRELGVFSEILLFNASLEEIKKRNPVGIVLSGGPSSIYDSESPQRKDILELLKIAPVLGICYGMQLLAYELGGKVESSKVREYGRMSVIWEKEKREQRVWMSHGDLVSELPKGAQGLAKSKSSHWAAMRSESPGKGYLGLQFHPEVSHTEDGLLLIRDFVFDQCGAKINWQGKMLAQHLIEKIKSQVGEHDSVICGLSGGVDSTVTATLLTEALGAHRVRNIFVDTGLLRLGESASVMAGYKKMGLAVECVDSSKEFLSALKNIADPETKRKIIGRVFIEVFDKAVKNLNILRGSDESKPEAERNFGEGRNLAAGLPRSFKYLAQGTLYPDVIESVNLRGQSVTIKSHHNVGGLPEKMNLKLVEPLRELFKDEVRVVGKECGVLPELLNRHPFPGPGLAIRILGSVNDEDLELLKKADAIFIDELKKCDLYSKIWQAFVVLLPVKTVGVMGDARTYERVAALRAVTSIDGMTADWFSFDHSFLSHVSNRITNEAPGINRVVYDISSKPPATIEWE